MLRAYGTAPCIAVRTYPVPPTARGCFVWPDAVAIRSRHLFSTFILPSEASKYVNSRGDMYASLSPPNPPFLREDILFFKPSYFTWLASARCLRFVAADGGLAQRV